VAIADVNRDGKSDLVVIPYNRDAKMRGGAANVTVLIGDGAGRFDALEGSPFPLGGCAQPTQVAVADLTGGTLLDIAATCVNSGQLALLTPEGRAYRLTVRPMQGNPYGIAAADFFGNGRPSLAVSNQANGKVTLLQIR
jgi:hypothetical protein